MELSYNNGTAFFFIESDDFVGATKDMKSVNRMIGEDVISFSVTEELGKLPTGNLMLKDDTGVYARVLRNGIRFKISWGYKQWNEDLKAYGAENSPPRGIRQGLKCIVASPSGSGNESGTITYSVTFYGEQMLSEAQFRVFENGTRGDVIEMLMRDLGTERFFIDFPTSRQRLSTTNSIRQRETSFALLRQLGWSWGAYTLVGSDKSGIKLGLFVQWEKVGEATSQKFVRDVVGADIDNKINFFFNCGQASNVKTFSWQQNIGENGGGDSTTITYVDGKPIFTRRVTEEGKVVTYKLNVDKVRKDMRKKGNLQDEMLVFQQIANTTDFEKVKHKYFDSSVETTAPQGAGYTINMSIHGNPLAVVMMKCYFRGGFPPPLMQNLADSAPINFYIKRATHNFSKGEYNTDLEIVDTFSLTGSQIAPEKSDFTPR